MVKDLKGILKYKKGDVDFPTSFKDLHKKLEIYILKEERKEKLKRLYE